MFMFFLFLSGGISVHIRAITEVCVAFGSLVQLQGFLLPSGS